MNFLHIDDDDSHAEIMQIIFEDYAGVHRLDRVSNGGEALAFLNKSGRYIDSATPDIIFLDINMPNILGTDLLPIIKANPLWLTIPVIVLSTSNADADRHKAYEAYVNAYVVKPMDVAGFEDLVSSIVDFWGNWCKLSA